MDEWINKAYERDDIPNDARERVGTRIHGLVNRSRKQKVQRRRWATLVATVTLLGASVLVGPKAYAYYRLSQIQGTLNDANTAVIRAFDIGEKGAQRPRHTIYYSRGRWRIEQPPLVMVYKQERLWTYNPQTKSVTVVQKRGGPFAYTPSGMSLSAMLGDIARWKWTQPVQLGTLRINRKSCETLTLVESDGRSRSMVIADPSTHMPFEMRGERLVEGQWRLRQLQELVFDEPVAEDNFSTEFPKDVAIVDLDKAAAKESVLLEKSLANFRLAGRLISIRDITVNARGHVFILFTDGSTVEQRISSLRRKLQTPPGARVLTPTEAAQLVQERAAVVSLAGYRNSRSTFQPFMTAVERERCEGLVLSDGQVLHGAWFVPNNGKAESLRFSFTAVKQSDPNKPLEMERKDWTVKSPPRQNGLVPHWSKLMSMSPKTDEEILAGEGPRLDHSSFKSR